jgi:hypothetical protein
MSSSTQQTVKNPPVSLLWELTAQVCFTIIQGKSESMAESTVWLGIFV